MIPLIGKPNKMTRFSILLSFGLLLLPATLGLVPQKFWNSRQRHNSATMASSKRARVSQRVSFKMYFDDCERRWLPDAWETWRPAFLSMIADPKSINFTTRSDSKLQAMERLLGYNEDSTASLSAEQIEDETLTWAVDNNVIWAGDDEQDDEALQRLDRRKAITSKYDSISDLIVASECKSTIDALAFLWELFARLMDNQELNSVYMVVFPNVSALWQYDVMVTLLQALKISQPLLPVQMQNVRLDLFHPRYKNSPRFLSPAMHSPFPTIGLSIQSEPSTVSHSVSLVGTPSNDNFADDLDAARFRLEALFASLDADDRVAKRLSEENMDTTNVLAECQRWALSRDDRYEHSKAEWQIEQGTEPFQMYKKIWSAIRKFQATSCDQKPMSIPATTTMIVAPRFDYHTTKRIAITVNAALRRLDSPIRIVDIFHPSSSSHARISPYAIIQLQGTTISEM